MSSIDYPGVANHTVFVDTDKIASLTVESDALAILTTANWLNVLSWQAPVRVAARDASSDPISLQAIADFEIDITADATETITGALLYGLRLRPVTIANDDVDVVDFGNNELDLTAHAYLTGDGPFEFTTSDTLPTGIELATSYFFNNITAGASITIHLTREDAVAGTNAVTFSDAGTGTHTIADVQGSTSSDDDTRRYHADLIGALNDSNDIVVGAQLGHVERIKHSPLTDYYVVFGNDTAVQTLLIRVIPVQEVEWPRIE